MAVGDKYFFIGDKTIAVKSGTVNVGDKVVCMKYNQGLIKPPVPAVGHTALLIDTSSGKVALKSEDEICADFWHSLRMGSTYATDATYAQVTTISETEVEVIFEDSTDFDWDDAIFRVKYISTSEVEIKLVSRYTSATHTYYYNNILLWENVTTQGTLNWIKTEPTHCGA